jgi:cold shock protein
MGRSARLMSLTRFPPRGLCGGRGAHWALDEQLKMPTGRVKFFNIERGFGFILPDDGGPDVFVHVHEVETTGMKTLVAGQLLAYDIGTARDGRSKAVNLRLLNPEC